MKALLFCVLGILFSGQHSSYFKEILEKTDVTM